MYVDETGIDTFIYREYGWSLKGTKVCGKINGKKYKRVNIVAGICGSTIIGEMDYACTMNSNFFEAWFEKLLIPELKVGQTIVMDNASFHNKVKLQNICDKYRHKALKLIFLPPYSPELNPIEKYWATLKRRLKKILPNTTEDIVDVIMANL